jgi:signal transduction histidine kinase
MPPTPLSFRTRLTVRWTVVFSCILAAASVSIYLGIRATTYADLDRNLRTLAGTEAASATDGAVLPHVHELPVPSLAGGTFTEKLVQVFDRQATVVVTSAGKAETLRFVDRSLIDAALAGEAPVTTVQADGLPIRVVVLRTIHEGNDYAIAVGVVISELMTSLGRVRWLLALVWLASTVATAAVGFALASTALAPVRRITQRAMEIAGNDLRARLEPPGVNDEIGTMATSLNSLLERLHLALDANRRFAADAAHELRSPVTAIAGEIDVALRRERTAAEYRDTLSLVRDRLSTLSSLMNDLMVLVRAQEGRDVVVNQEVSLKTALDASIVSLAPLARPRGVTIETEGLDGVVVYGDAGLLGRVFDNVLGNAIRYNRTHGLVSVRASFTDSLASSWEPGMVTVSISDTGPGIPAAEWERVFDRFYRVDESRTRHTGGAGLGLAIAREVLMLFKGTIRITASSGQGTTVEIRMPGRLPGSAPPFSYAGLRIRTTSHA